jgi:beta-glucanase (GH16 family)
VIVAFHDEVTGDFQCYQAKHVRVEGRALTDDTDQLVAAFDVMLGLWVTPDGGKWDSWDVVLSSSDEPPVEQ